MSKKIPNNPPDNISNVNAPQGTSRVVRGPSKSGKLLSPHVPDSMEPPPQELSDSLKAAGRVPSEVHIRVPQQRKNPKSSTTGRSSHGELSLRAKALGSLAIIVLIVLSLTLWLRGDFGDQSPYEEYWSGGNEREMKKVAEYVYQQPRSSVAEMIIEEALKGERRPPVRDHLLRTAFRREWDHDLTDLDRSLVMRIALLGIAPSSRNEITINNTIHPGVLYALISDLPENAFDEELKNISIETLFKLPAPFGPAFQQLGAIGTKTIADKSARALATIISGVVNEESINHYFEVDFTDSEQAEALMLAKFRILFPWITRFDPLGPLLVGFSQAQSAVLSERLRWFDEEHQDFWSGVPLAAKLYLVGSLIPEFSFSFEQFADLMKFPSTVVKKEAARRIAPVFHRSMTMPLAFLSSSENKFTRPQVVLLLSALRLETDAAMPFFTSWFATNPDTATVVGFLAETARAQGLASFNLEAGRYLKNKEWQATKQQLENLIFHPEAMIRALSYTKLDPTQLADLLLLKKALSNERDLKLRDRLRDRIAGAVDEME